MRLIAGAVVFALMLGPGAAGASSTGQSSEIDAASAYYRGATGAPTVENQNPRPGSRLRTYFPQFFATIVTHGDAPLRKDSLHLSVDGTDVTTRSSITGGSVSYMPREHLRAGWHDVFLEGADAAGKPFSDAWAFQTEAPDGIGITDPAAGLQVVQTGDTRSGFAHVFFTSPDDGFALLQLCGFPAIGFVHVRLSPVFFLTVPVQFFDGFVPFGGCVPQVAFSPFGGFGSIFIPLPISVAGPGFFHDHHHHHRPGEWPRNTMPVIRTVEPSYNSAVPGRVTMPQVRMPSMSLPQVIVPRVTVPHAGVPNVTMPHVTAPRVIVPHVTVPVSHPSRP